MLGGVAIVDETAGLVAETRLNVKTTHSERLMTAVHNTLRQSELSLDQIDAFAVAIGPGSFTGLRIGLSTVKGLSYATGKPVVTVPTLDAFAWNFPFCAYPVCLMLDARKGEVYAALYEWKDSGFRTSMECVSIKPDALLQTLQGRVLFAGEGALLYREKILAMMQERALFAGLDKMVPAPANVAMLGMDKAVRGAFEVMARDKAFLCEKIRGRGEMVGKELSGISIDDMKVVDLPEVLAIETASFTTPWSEILFRNEISKAISVSHVARKDGRVVGYLCANIILDEGHILNLSVHPEHRRLGIASVLIRDMIAHHEGE